MKILLATTPPNKVSINPSLLVLLEPLALEYIGAGVQNDHDVKIVDLRSPTEPRLKEVMESFQPDIIGCGGVTIDINPIKEMLIEAKNISPNILTVVGGHHPTIKPQDLYEDYIDVIVAGEGVHPFRKVCEAYERKTSFENIENIYYKANGKMVFTHKEEHPELDALPIPARNLTAHLRPQYHNYFLSRPIPFALARATLGCYFNCKFCAVTSMLGRKVYRHSIDRIIEELQSIEEEYVYWVDDEFILDPEMAVLLAKEIEKAGIKKYHSFCARSDTILRSPQCIEEWAKIGLKEVLVGFETHREEELKKMRKGTTLSKNEEVIRIIHENNTFIRVNFIINQDYTVDDFQKLIDYVKKLDLDMTRISVWTPLPGTDLFETERPNLLTENYNLFDFYHTVLPTKLPIKEFYKQMANSFKEISAMERQQGSDHQISPQDQWKFTGMMFKMIQRLENGYQDY